MVANASTIVGAWLVESKQSVIENMAPVLTRLFTPLFAILLLFFVATMIWTGNAIDVEREVSPRDADLTPEAADTIWSTVSRMPS